MDYKRTIEIDAEYDDAVARTKAALAEQGFGILWEIDMKAVLKAKRGADIEPYVILGACNPALAERALGVDRAVGVLLPCNVVVSARDGGGSVVRVLEPEMFPALSGLAGLEPVAADASRLLQGALDAISGN